MTKSREILGPDECSRADEGSASGGTRGGAGVTTFEQARAMYGSDEQMARTLFEQLTIARLGLELQQALRRRAEDRLSAYADVLNRVIEEGRTR